MVTVTVNVCCYQCDLQKDSSLSRLLFSSLLTAIMLEMEQVLTESEVDTARAAIREGMQQTLQSSLLYHPPFIGDIQVGVGHLCMDCNNFLPTIRIFAITKSTYS